MRCGGGTRVGGGSLAKAAPSMPPLHLPYISPTPPLHLPYTSPTSPQVLARYDADLSGLMELDEFVRLAHGLGYLGVTGGGASALGAPALPPPLDAAGGWADEGTRRAGELVVLLGGVSDLPASPNPNRNPNRNPNPNPNPIHIPNPNPNPLTL